MGRQRGAQLKAWKARTSLAVPRGAYNASVFVGSSAPVGTDQMRIQSQIIRQHKMFTTPTRTTTHSYIVCMRVCVCVCVSLRRLK